MEDEGSILLDGKTLANLRVVDLKLELDKRGLSKSGSKKDLVKRLKQQLEFEKLCGERKLTGDCDLKLETGLGKLLAENTAFVLDADTEQNEFVQQYLAQQQKIYAEQKEVKRLVELEEVQKSGDEKESCDSSKDDDDVAVSDHPTEVDRETEVVGELHNQKVESADCVNYKVADLPPSAEQNAHSTVNSNSNTPLEMEVSSDTIKDLSVHSSGELLEQELVSRMNISSVPYSLSDIQLPESPGSIGRSAPKSSSQQVINTQPIEDELVEDSKSIQSNGVESTGSENSTVKQISGNENLVSEFSNKKGSLNFDETKVNIKSEPFGKEIDDKFIASPQPKDSDSEILLRQESRSEASDDEGSSGSREDQKRKIRSKDIRHTKGDGKKKSANSEDGRSSKRWNRGSSSEKDSVHKSKKLSGASDFRIKSKEIRRKDKDQRRRSVSSEEHSSTSQSRERSPIKISDPKFDKLYVGSDHRNRSRTATRKEHYQKRKDRVESSPEGEKIPSYTKSRELSQKEQLYKKKGRSSEDEHSSRSQSRESSSDKSKKSIFVSKKLSRELSRGEQVLKKKIKISEDEHSSRSQNRKNSPEKDKSSSYSKKHSKLGHRIQSKMSRSSEDEHSSRSQSRDSEPDQILIKETIPDTKTQSKKQDQKRKSRSSEDEHSSRNQSKNSDTEKSLVKKPITDTWVPTKERDKRLDSSEEKHSSGSMSRESSQEKVSTVKFSTFSAVPKEKSDDFISKKQDQKRRKRSSEDDCSSRSQSRGSSLEKSLVYKSVNLSADSVFDPKMKLNEEQDQKAKSSEDEHSENRISVENYYSKKHSADSIASDHGIKSRNERESVNSEDNSSSTIQSRGNGPETRSIDKSENLGVDSRLKSPWKEQDQKIKSRNLEDCHSGSREHSSEKSTFDTSNILSVGSAASDLTVKSRLKEQNQEGNIKRLDDEDNSKSQSRERSSERSSLRKSEDFSDIKHATALPPKYNQVDGKGDHSKLKQSAIMVIKKDQPKQRIKIKRDNIFTSDISNMANKGLSNESQSKISDSASKLSGPIENKKSKIAETSEVPVAACYVSRKIVLSSRKPKEEFEDEPTSKRSKWGSFAASRKARQTINISTDSLKNWFPDFKLLKDPIPTTDFIVEEPSPPVKENIEIPGEKLDEGIRASANVKRSEQLAFEPEKPFYSDAPATKILFVQNLVRPFTVGQLKALLNETGDMLEEDFWIDKIKSKCFVTYETEKEAMKTKNALNGTRWPTSNPKILSVEFSTEEELNFHKSGGDTTKHMPTPQPTETPLMSQESHTVHPAEDYHKKEPELDRKRDRARQQQPIREWDKDKVKQESLEREWGGKENEKAKVSDKKDKKDTKKRANEDTPAKLLDDLFQKTKSSPCIYWLPMTDEQVRGREESKRLRRIEREKRTQEQEEADQKNKRPRSRQRTREREIQRSSTRSRSPISRRR